MSTHPSLHPHALIILVTTLAIGIMQASAEEAIYSRQQYVQPSLFEGSLAILADDLSDREIAKNWIRSQIGPDGSSLFLSSDAKRVLALHHSWKVHENSLSCKLNLEEEVDTPPSPWSRSLGELSRSIGQMGRGDVVILDDSIMADPWDSQQAQDFGGSLKQLLMRGGGVVMTMERTGCEPKLASIVRRKNRRLIAELIDDVAIGSVAEQKSELVSNALKVDLEPGAIALIQRRDIRVASSSAGVIITAPGTAAYPKPLSMRVAKGRDVDLTCWRRAVAERRVNQFPGSSDRFSMPQSGKLVIVGGGGAPAEIWKTFIDLAGGLDSKIIVLPTAVEAPPNDCPERRMLERLGATNVKVLPQVARGEVDSERYLAEFENAKGIWFGGGRQWRFVDAYWGTPAWDAIIQTMKRGGVVGGSSAGATIQGDLLVRGHPIGNHIMIADGYRRGLGLLPGSAIDQHFRQRNRFKDLSDCLKPFPQILGIGIDESTALVVEARDRARVIGNGSVWILPTAESIDDERSYVEYATGSIVELK